ncbi:LysM peptidoglycan-binding domain-containing protein [Paenibacillus apiarius]|uniref:LysM peptidoglycan-binding domain-containing protein n=1 Tax=Paenibacillus apiarius TaxID=46240 RepID=UPI00197CE1E8|nr:LysM peptidoglycan-binding domain-containing protein [Paenibacillus apiarius]
MKIHIVKKGDSLYSLSKKYDVSLEKLIEMNPQLKDPNELDVGMKIKVPSSKYPQSGHEIIHKHVVKDGDTLWKLSKAWGIPLQTMIDANPQLKNPNVLVIGQVINIPKVHAGMTMPSAGAAHPDGKADLTKPKAELTKPKAEITKPKAELTKPIAVPEKEAECIYEIEKVEVVKPPAPHVPPKTEVPAPPVAPPIPTYVAPSTQVQQPSFPPIPVLPPPIYQMPAPPKPYVPMLPYPEMKPCECEKPHHDLFAQYAMPATEAMSPMPPMPMQHAYPDCVPYATMPMHYPQAECIDAYPAMPSAIYPPVPPIYGAVSSGVPSVLPSSVPGAVPSYIPAALPTDICEPMIQPYAALPYTTMPYAHALPYTTMPYAHAMPCDCDKITEPAHPSKMYTAPSSCYDQPGHQGYVHAPQAYPDSYVSPEAGWYNPAAYSSAPAMPAGAYETSLPSKPCDCGCYEDREEELPADFEPDLSVSEVKADPRGKNGKEKKASVRGEAQSSNQNEQKATLRKKKLTAAPKKDHVQSLPWING